MIKCGINQELRRLERIDSSARIRKLRHVDSLRKRRMKTCDVGENVAGMGNSMEQESKLAQQTDPETETSIQKPDSCTSSLRKDLLGMIASMERPSFEEKLAGMRAVRKLLSHGSVHKLPVKDAVDAGCLPFCFEFLKLHQHPEIQLEAVWALTNIASVPGFCEAAYNRGMVLDLVAPLLYSSNHSIHDTAIWLVGNLAGESIEYQTAIFRQSRIVQGILGSLQNPPTVDILKTATWCMSNLCRHAPDVCDVARFIPTIRDIIGSCKQHQVVTDACHSICYLAQASSEMANMIVNTGMCLVMGARLSVTPGHADDWLVPCIKTLGFLASKCSSRGQRESILTDYFCRMNKLMEYFKLSVQKAAFVSLAQVTNDGSLDTIQIFIQTPMLPRRIIQQFDTADFSVRQQAMIVIANLSQNECALKALLQYGLFESVCNRLDAEDTKILLLALQVLQRIINLDPAEYVSKIESCYKLPTLERLMSHPHQQISSTAEHLYEIISQPVEDVEMKEY
uniref:Importin subunit alpha n=1 Tax=Mucochytrium quahogii TaxID=96639 RepID=A0A7S2RRE4_9STRA|mmetsp:Transcript_38831/g.62533  ORF Transcript_38831/g.62533 Transcript_38831/m.62533 type:complete len:510 (+) Transcript_38831:566-2095(+)